MFLFPGAMGTELQRSGYQTKLPLWSAGANMDAPDLVEEIHDKYFSAGADCAVTNTFRTTPRTYRKIGLGGNEAREALFQSVAIARKSARKCQDRPVFVAGSFAPLEDCYEPHMVPREDDLGREHRQLADWLAEAGVDFLLPETINHKTEALHMAQAASQTGLPFMISFVVTEKGTLLDGSPLADVIRLTDLPGRYAVMLNCRCIDVISGALDMLCREFPGVKGVYANGIGHPHPDQGWIFDTHLDSVMKYRAAAARWLDMGVKIIGGCCGTTPEYIRALRNLCLDEPCMPEPVESLS